MRIYVCVLYIYIYIYFPAREARVMRFLVKAPFYFSCPYSSSQHPSSTCLLNTIVISLNIIMNILVNINILINASMLILINILITMSILIMINILTTTLSPSFDYWRRREPPGPLRYGEFGSSCSSSNLSFGKREHLQRQNKALGDPCIHQRTFEFR
jgi:hypothetical protein